jgi:hypothetical protein
MYPSAGVGNAWSSSTRQPSSSIAAINPCFMSFCRWPGGTMEGVQSFSTMAQGGRQGSTFKILVFSPYFLFSRFLLFMSIFLFSRRREGDKDRTADGAQGRPPASNLAASVVKRLGPLRRSKGSSKLSLPASPTPRTSRQLQQQGIHNPYPQWAPRWLGGLLKLNVRRRNPLDGSKPPRVTEVRDKATQRVDSS